MKKKEKKLKNINCKKCSFWVPKIKECYLFSDGGQEDCRDFKIKRKKNENNI